MWRVCACVPVCAAPAGLSAVWVVADWQTGRVGGAEVDLWVLEAEAVKLNRAIGQPCWHLNVTARNSASLPNKRDNTY